MKKPKYIRIPIPVLDQKIAVYATPRLAEALKEVAFDMDLYKGVKLSQVLEAVYAQGKKDGARSVFDKADALKGLVSHRNPGRPRKRKKR